MRFFVYEFVTGGGWWTVDPLSLPTNGLFREGSAMVQALAADLARIGTVSVLRDSRCQRHPVEFEAQVVGSCAEERRAFAESVQRADWTVIIAPEFDGHLSSRCEWVEQLGGRLLSPNSAFVSVTSDKQRTAELLAESGVRVPRGLPFPDAQSQEVPWRFPAVLKQRDGAGSKNVQAVFGWSHALGLVIPGQQYRLEEFHRGIAASVSVLLGSGQCIVLPASRQLLSDDGQFQYLGGITPLSPDLCHRAERLARATIAALPPTVGYVGIDLVFGSATDGSDDVVIEVNPRITTSYLGLRQIVRENLAEAMWRAAQGELVDLSFAARPVQFAADSGNHF